MDKIFRQRPVEKSDCTIQSSSEMNTSFQVPFYEMLAIEDPLYDIKPYWSFCLVQYVLLSEMNSVLAKKINPNLCLLCQTRRLSTPHGQPKREPQLPRSTPWWQDAAVHRQWVLLQMHPDQWWTPSEELFSPCTSGTETWLYQDHHTKEHWYLRGFYAFHLQPNFGKRCSR